MSATLLIDQSETRDAAGEAAGIVLFRSQDLLVKAVGTPSGAVAFVTFDSYTDAHTLDRAGFGEDFFRARGIPAAHVVSRDNRWYQYPETPDALAAIRAWAEGFDRVVAYGSSMGGFAALTYGAACGADVGVALSPQYSVDPRVAPFEDRWAGDVARIGFQPPPTETLPLQYLVYDPRDPFDARHAAMFAARSPTIAIRAPYGGHPVGAFLNEAGLLASLIERVADGSQQAEDVPALERGLREGRRRSGQYLFTLAQAVPERRPRHKALLARMAVEAQPLDPVYLSYHAAMLDQDGRYSEAHPIHLRALALPTAGPHTAWRLLMHHRLQGALAEAERFGERMTAAYPASSLLRVTLEGVRREKRRTTWLGRLADRLRIESAVDYLARRWHRWLWSRRLGSSAG